MIFRRGGKNCTMKNEKWIVFSKSQYINSNPVGAVLEQKHHIWHPVCYASRSLTSPEKIIVNLRKKSCQ